MNFRHLRPRFFLSTLLLLTLLMASGVLLWLHWDAWYLERAWQTSAHEPNAEAFIWAFSPDHSYLVTTQHTNILRAWDTLTGTELGHMNNANKTQRASWIHPHNNRTVTLTTDHHLVSLWDIKTGNVVPRVSGATFPDIIVNPDGTLCLASMDPDTASVWDLTQDREIFKIPHTQSTSKFHWSPDGKYIVVLLKNSRFEIWDVKAAKCIHVSEADVDVNSPFSFSADGSQFITLDSTSIRLWETATGRSILRQKCAFPQLDFPEFLADNQWLGASVSPTVMQFWNIKDGTPALQIATNPAEEIRTLRFSPDGRKLMLLSCGSTADVRFLRVLDRRTGQHLGQIPGDKIDDYFFLGDHLIVVVYDKVHIYRNRRPEPLYGVLYLPEFWLTLFLAAALAWNLHSNMKRARSAVA